MRVCVVCVCVLERKRERERENLCVLCFIVFYDRQNIILNKIHFYLKARMTTKTSVADVFMFKFRVVALHAFLKVPDMDDRRIFSRGGQNIQFA